MIHDIFFGDFAVVMWFFASAVFVFCATYIWFIVLEVRGLRGTCLAIIFTSLAIVTSGFGLLLSDQALISAEVIGAAVSAVWPPIVICALILTDLYAADRNNHRSFTSRSYTWYRRIIKDGREDNRPRHPVRLGGRNA